MKRNLWRCATAVFAAALILCVFGDVAVAALDLKIGYFDYDGYVTVDENGQITGYVGDILDMLVEANPHWNFVPVLFERASFNENMRKGYAVLSMQTPYAAASPRYYLYSEYPVGVEWGIFYTSLDQHIYYEDFAMFEGMRVGSIATDLQNSLFDEYQAANGFSVEYVLFNNLDDMKKALADKEIDGLIYGSVVEQEDLKIVARYAEVPLHVAGNEWGASFVDYFDRVLGAALAEDPYFFDALYAKYYDDAPRAVQAMTEEEEKAAELARIAEEEAAAKAAAEEAARKAEEEARRAVEEAAAAAQADGEQPDENVDGDGDMEKKLTQAGFIIVVALLAVLLISALIRNKSRKIAKTAKPAQAIKPEKAAKPAKAEKEARIKAQKEAKAKAEEEARVEAENEARRKAEEEARAKAEEEAKIAEEAAKKAMEEAKIKAEEDAKNRLIEEARIRALEIARFKAEEEARMKNEEARRQNQKPVAMQTGSLRE
ncbi:MAG: transporter substrate-binding domain-containing protein, partial [Peptococcaceae bacterium]|nr:transporter substrate-binding domain-containing protein [Peptococcaceae bacterium]